jgi:lincosamide nucleotidyltransferase A/C/D/E
MSEERAAALVALLGNGGVDACVGGGWAVDALLGRQTRDHADLDLWVEAVDAEALFATFAEDGLDRVFPWPGDRPWNFVLHDGAARRVDLHFYEVVAPGLWRYGSALDDTTYPLSALSGRGQIAAARVRCESPEWSVRCHTGYPARESDRHDVMMLCQHFGFPLPSWLEPSDDDRGDAVRDSLR